MSVAEGEISEVRVVTVERSFADRVVPHRRMLVAGSVTLVVIVLICVFLVVRSLPAIRRVGFVDYLTTMEWRASADPPVYGVAALMYGTVVVAVIALVIAVPLAIGAALCINEYAPRRLRRPLTSLVDLLAAIPSVIYGIWGLVYPAPDDGGLRRLDGRLPGFHPHLPPDVAHVPRLDVQRRAGGVVHGPADRDGDRPRGVQPGAAHRV